VPVLDGVLVTVAIWFWKFSQVESTTEPSAVVLKCAVMQADQFLVVELEDVGPPSARKLEPALYEQAGMLLSLRGMRMPPTREQQADTAVSLFAQHPARRNLY
jgi:hypothetical protein